MTCSAYAVMELRPDQAGGFAPRGALKTLWQTRDHETIVSGPAETGKTFGCLSYVHALLWKHPGAQAVMARRTYASLVGSCLRTFTRILGDGSPVKPYGGEKPEWFSYPNGSRLWVVGLDNPGKALSSERDFIYVNQCEELTLADWETLVTRCTGRGGTAPYSRIIGDCNPDTPTHWIKAREKTGALRLLESRHEDNPTLYGDDGRLTAQGQRSLGILDKLSGTRYLRLRKGLWVSAEGVVYDEWDPAVHVVDTLPAGWEQWTKFRSVDFGYRDPFACGWYAKDPDGGLLLYREFYRTGCLVEDHAKTILEHSAGETYEATVADHDAEDRATLERHGVKTIPAYKLISPGIQAVQARLRPQENGRVRLRVYRNALIEADPELLEQRKPTCTVDEFAAYSWPLAKDGKPVKEVPVDLYNHGLDELRYVVAHVDGLQRRKLEFLTWED